MVSAISAEKSFHPLKSGRDFALKLVLRWLLKGFHPLKSGRDSVDHHSAPHLSHVSIPSSRVGTHNSVLLKNLQPFPSPQVGSGLLYNPQEHIPIAAVSIPSSRVGTGRNCRESRMMPMFPSPQVGSGLVNADEFSRLGGGFHPLKSGRDFWGRMKALGLTPGFPSPQVGSGPYPKPALALPPPRFHPLKSGRDQIKAALEQLQHQCFHPLKSGRD